jgi:molybdopterin converting factor small subunit
MAQHGPVIVEFFGVPRARAGRTELSVSAGTVAELLAAIEASCPALKGVRRADGGPASQYLLSLDGREFLTDPAHRLRPGDRVLLLSADAGGGRPPLAASKMVACEPDAPSKGERQPRRPARPCLARRARRNDSNRSVSPTRLHG